jgi:hypothetical protein
MTLALFFLFSLATVPLAGGRISRLADAKVNGGAVLVLALGVQILIVSIFPSGGGDFHRSLHLGTYALAAYALVVNRHLPFIKLIALGGALNFAAIVANGGVMPASRSALAAAGLATKPGEFANSDIISDANLSWLGDVFATPSWLPGANVFSVGDIVMGVGGLLCLHALTNSRLAASLTRRDASEGSEQTPLPSDESA